MGIADPLRTEHAQLLPQLEALPTAAIATEGREDEVLAALDAALAFLRESLIPHARAEDAVLYPMVEQVMHAPGATATMSRDHLEVVRLTAALQRARDSLQGAPDPTGVANCSASCTGCTPSSDCTSPRKRSCISR